jgi:hypothetical protein
MSHISMLEAEEVVRSRKWKWERGKHKQINMMSHISTESGSGSEGLGLGHF